MPAIRFKGQEERRLRRGLGLFLLALAIPTGVLIQHTYRQLKWEAFYQYQMLAEELAGRIDVRLNELVRGEERRSFADYAFLVVAGDPAARFLQRSPLSAYPVTSEIPGLIGYFQIDSQGELSTPLLPSAGTDPAAYGVSAAELAQRGALQDRIALILTDNRLVQQGPVPAGRVGVSGGLGRSLDPLGVGGTEQERMGTLGRERGGLAPEEASREAQAAFDRLEEGQGGGEKREQRTQGVLGRVEDLKLDSAFQPKGADESQRQGLVPRSAALDKRGARKERGALPESPAPAVVRSEPVLSAAPAKPRIATFETELDPFALSRLDSGQFVLYRKVWRAGQRIIQGALIEQRPFLQGALEAAFRDTSLSRMSELIVAFRGEVLGAFSGASEPTYLERTPVPRGALLYQTRLSDPLSSLQLIFTLTRLPVGAGAAVVGWTTAVLLLVVCSGCYLLYRLGMGQIQLARQQQDFVSAVTHELKTPLTAIRMYSEMLREGWVTEEKRAAYYRFIHEESERLSRLITNVLQLARLTRNELRVDLKAVTLGELMGGVGAKVASQAEQAGMSLHLDFPAPLAGLLLRADADYFAQILINLVDNAIKFSAKATEGRIDLSVRHEGRWLVVSVRDYGPGVPRDQMRKIFRLFYRAESELTRETVGTGIGLALVRQMAQSMGGSVEVVNREPGAEFRLSLPADS